MNCRLTLNESSRLLIEALRTLAPNHRPHFRREYYDEKVSEEAGFSLRFDKEAGEWKAEIAL